MAVALLKDGAGQGLIGPDLAVRLKQAAEALVIPLCALLVSGVLFGLFIAALGKSPLELYALMYKGGFGTWFSWQNTLQRAAPLLLTALCVAIPAQLGLVVIGGEGALVLGGLAAAAIAPPFRGPPRWWFRSAWRSPP
jgi:simple sugar transport system permease protein